MLDTNAYSGFKKNDLHIVHLLQMAEVIVMSPIVLGELLAGFECGNKAKKNKEELEFFLESSRVKLYAITLDTSHFFSQIYSQLKRKGMPIPTNDMWIAAQAFEHGCFLCTYDKHFQAIEGLTIV